MRYDTNDNTRGYRIGTIADVREGDWIALEGNAGFGDDDFSGTADWARVVEIAYGNVTAKTEMTGHVITERFDSAAAIAIRD